MIPKDYLLEHAKQFGVSLNEKQLEQFDQYAKVMLDWNKSINLTSITDPEEIVIKHFIDSLAILGVIGLKTNAALIDVGAGAGFPSTPIAIARTDLRVTQLDSLQKRIAFLDEVSRLLGLNITTIHKRAEDGGREPELREQFDYVTARAVAPLNVLCEYCLPYLKPGGKGIFLKGYDIEEELEQASGSIEVLGCRLEKLEKLVLPQNNRRSIILVKKISQTLAIYPRNSKKIKNFPL